MLALTIFPDRPKRIKGEDQKLKHSASVEADMRFNHNLYQDAYDLGRNYIVGNVTGREIRKTDVRLGHAVFGQVSNRGWRYSTTVDWVDDLLRLNRSEWSCFLCQVLYQAFFVTRLVVGLY